MSKYINNITPNLDKCRDSVLLYIKETAFADTADRFMQIKKGTNRLRPLTGCIRGGGFLYLFYR